MSNVPSSSRADYADHPILVRVVPSRMSPPSILRRKRGREERVNVQTQGLIVINEEVTAKRPTIQQTLQRYHQHLPPAPRLRIPTERESDYLRKLSKKYNNGGMKSMMRVRYCSENSMSDEEIIRRLSSRIECHLDILSCGYPMCGRTFDTLQLLAFHISYSHHDAASLAPESAVCYVCGHRMANTKGKNAHLMNKHKDLCREHNQQCVDQRDIVIAPDAPAAIRLVDNQMYLRRKLENDMVELDELI